MIAPMVPIRIKPAGRDVWEQFAEYHYLEHPIHRCCECYLAWYGPHPVGCLAMLYQHGFPGYWRISRLAVMPAYQGLGVGGQLLDEIAQLYFRDRGALRVGIVTALLPVIEHCEHSPLWTRTRRLRHGNAPQLRYTNEQRRYLTSAGRAVVAFSYAPADIARSTGRKS